MHWTSQTQCVATTRPGKHPSVPTAVETTDVNLLWHSTTQNDTSTTDPHSATAYQHPLLGNIQTNPTNSGDSHSECSRCSAGSNKGNQQLATSDSTGNWANQLRLQSHGVQTASLGTKPNYNRTVTECTGVLLSPRGLVEPTCTLGSNNHVSGTPVRIRKLHGVPLQSPPLMYVNALPYVHAPYAPTEIVRTAVPHQNSLFYPDPRLHVGLKQTRK